MALKERYLQDVVVEDLTESMVFIGGPRQVGKTTLARDIICSRFKTNYYNWDKIEHRVKALKGEWEPDTEKFIKVTDMPKTLGKIRGAAWTVPVLVIGALPAVKTEAGVL
jgi:hypothetical protein